MGVYNQMQDMGLIEDVEFYEAEMIDYKGDAVKRLFVDITHKNNIITLYSNLEYSEEISRLAFGLEKTFLMSVKLAKVPALQTSSIFSKKESATLTYEEYTAYENILYTPEGIYLCKNSWKDDKEKKMIASEVSSSSRLFGIREKEQKHLNYLGATKIIDFSEHTHKLKEKTIYSYLIDLGATVVEPLSYHRDREKVSGAMYDGRAALALDDVTYRFTMWHHHNSSEDMTEQEVIENLGLKHITINKTKHQELFGVKTPIKETVFGDEIGFDASWNAVRINNNVFLHPQGWFGSMEPRCQKLYEDKTEVLNKIAVYGFEPELVFELESLGFVKLI